MTKADILSLLKVTPDGVVLPRKAQPRSSRNAMGDLYGDAVKIFLTAPPVEGKANAELCKFLAKAAGLPKSAVSVVSGDTSRNKMVCFCNITADELAEKLASC